MVPGLEPDWTAIQRSRKRHTQCYVANMALPVAKTGLDARLAAGADARFSSTAALMGFARKRCWASWMRRKECAREQ